jgi:hypothetical protein
MTLGVEDFAGFEEKPKEVESGPGNLELMAFFLATNLFAKVVLKELKEEVDMIGSGGSIVRGMGYRLVILVMSQLLSVMI